VEDDEGEAEEGQGRRRKISELEGRRREAEGVV
jgi:hypothetical protein